LSGHEAGAKPGTSESAGVEGRSEQTLAESVVSPTSSESSDQRVLVVEASGVVRPYMRGIMVHSLMARGVGFDDAYSTAQTVADRINGRGTIERVELSKIVREILGEDPENEPPAPLPVTLQVVGNRGSTHFSKGTLSQSLLAASLVPDDAFEVARQIETGLILQGREQVTQVELRRLAYDALLNRFGLRVAERYLVWREFEEPDKPVIILLGGTAGVGKTSLALAVAQRLGVSRMLSTDSIRHIMRIMLSADLVPAIHVSSFDAYRELPALGHEDDPVIDGFLSQATTVLVGVRAMLDRAIEENTSLVLDGVALVPGLIDLTEYADRAHVFFLMVGRLDEKAFETQFEARARRQRARGAARYVERLEEILKIQEYLLEQAERNNVPIVDNVTVDGSALLVIRHVVESLRTDGGIDFADLI
jgi:2-phosphoglycerate kinase